LTPYASVKIGMRLPEKDRKIAKKNVETSFIWWYGCDSREIEMKNFDADE